MKEVYFRKQFHAFFQSFQLFYKQILLLILFTVIHNSAYGELSCYAKGNVESRRPLSEQEKVAQERINDVLPELREARISQGVLELLLTELRQKGYGGFLYNLRTRKRNEEMYYLLSLLNENQLGRSLRKLRQYAVDKVKLAKGEIHAVLSDLKKQELHRLLSDLILSNRPDRLHVFLLDLGSREFYGRALSRLSAKEIESLRQNFEYRIRGANAGRSFVSSDISKRKRRTATKKNEEVSFVAIDFETTGLKANIDEITEVGAVRYVNGHPIEAFQTLIRRVPDGGMIKVLRQEVLKLTGITDEMLQQESNPTIDGVIEPLIQFLGKDHVVAHNAEFDVSFLRAAYDRLNGSVEVFNEAVEIYNQQHNTTIAAVEKVRKPEGSIIDTLELSRRILSDAVDSHALGNLAKFLGIDHGTLHRAQEDSYCCGEVLIHLLDRVSSESQLSRGEVLRALADEEAGSYTTIVDRLLEDNEQQ